MRTILLLHLLLISWTVQATPVLVVKEYNKAELQEVWKKTKTDQVPEELLGSYDNNHQGSGPFQVCFRNCVSTYHFAEKEHALELNNVNYWLAKYFAFLQENFSFRSTGTLKVYTNRDIKDEVGEEKLTNNAFFNPKDNTLSFLPARNKFMRKFLGKDLNRSGFDPSVIVHEVSHFFFNQLFPHAINAEMEGLNEGFADYMSNVILENPKVGLIMLRGEAARDSSSVLDRKGNLKVYSPKMEAHFLGERVSFVLWKSRKLAVNKREFDRSVIDAVSELAENPYSTVHDFKRIMQEKVKLHIPARDFKDAMAAWEVVFPGPPATIKDMRFLDHPTKGRSFVGFSIKETHPADYAREMGLPLTEDIEFTLVRTEAIGPYQKAIMIGVKRQETILPYWVVIDALRSNVLGVFNTSGELVKDPEELKVLSVVATQLCDSISYISDFMKKLSAFTGLWKNEGELKSAYKVKMREVSEVAVPYNQASVLGHLHSMDLKQKFLARLLSDIPEIERLSLFTLPIRTTDPSIPEIDGNTVVGYILRLKGGKAMEVRINKTGLLD